MTREAEAGERAPLVEVFHSIQGEGRFVGVGMAFVRVAVCPIRCRYCDTPHSYRAPATFPVRCGGEARREPNPVDGARAAELALSSAAGSPYSVPGRPAAVSVTGGEPLLYPDFVLALGRALGASGNVHLETAALDADALRVALPVIRHVSADYKLPETLAHGEHRRAHRACVELVASDGRATLDVKLVLTADLDAASYARALDDLQPFGERLLLVLQPVTPFGAAREPAGPGLIAACATEAAERGFEFRVIPQVHRALSVE